MKLLIIEDEREISDSICQYFAGEEFLCDTAYDYRNNYFDTLPSRSARRNIVIHVPQTVNYGA